MSKFNLRAWTEIINNCIQMKLSNKEHGYYNVDLLCRLGEAPKCLVEYLMNRSAFHCYTYNEFS